ncbi:hypothetical protein P167DRAFT_33173 [Morchella conica CCBAS932]|uniref:Uncharacterized protein n=1 Tax=Morchella conica CCBAS932 TaxID=1392247 RepID=A0A3N4L083_9PEZI|nr:hypothetical protein P167DRAFT_33173 [Morchella conica CCBAS932]
MFIGTQLRLLVSCSAERSREGRGRKNYDTRFVCSTPNVCSWFDSRGGVCSFWAPAKNSRPPGTTHLEKPFGRELKRNKIPLIRTLPTTPARTGDMSYLANHISPRHSEIDRIITTPWRFRTINFRCQLLPWEKLNLEDGAAKCGCPFFDVNFRGHVVRNLLPEELAGCFPVHGPVRNHRAEALRL